MYLMIRKYRKVEGDLNQMVDTIKNGFVPLISKIDGFIDFYECFAEDGSLTSVSVYRDKKGAEESLRVAAAWVEQNMSRFLPEPPEVTSGDIVLQRHGEKQRAA